MKAWLEYGDRIAKMEKNTEFHGNQHSPSLLDTSEPISTDKPKSTIQRVAKELNVPEETLKKQLGRRNLTDEQRTVLIGKMYEVRKKIAGAPIGNKNAEKQCTQNGNIESKSQRVSEQIAQKLGVSKNTVIRAEKFSKGIDKIKEVSPEAAGKILKVFFIFRILERLTRDRQPRQNPPGVGPGRDRLQWRL